MGQGVYGRTPGFHSWAVTVFDFLISVNDLPEVVEECTINLYADDTTIYSADNNPVMLGSRVEGDLERVVDWISSNGLRMNVAKTQLMVLSRRGRRDEANSIQVKVGNDELKKKDCVRYLDVKILLGRHILRGCTGSVWASWQ